ncbi:AAA family ATPase [Cellulosimicrobium sp. CUA-896]|uniref:AAA family ATPase n=1 Tax=Cellulosimicrobium sp. CUA-896 TaxID=1517881 RepID=UPI0021013A7D|nr:ATP-binding protein [Cellulosimicrobium sp. CUA-896]
MTDGLLGRHDELARLRAVVDAARSGHGGALVVRGEPGVGKTALLAEAVGSGAGVRVAHADGFEAESSIAYAALHRVVAPWRGTVDGLPPQHRRALRTVLGLDAGQAPDRFGVGLGLLELLAAVGRDGPVALVVDDVHWLDAESAAVLALVARRLDAEPVAVLLACRDDPQHDATVAGIPVLHVRGLDDASAGRLLTSRVREPVDPLVVARVVRATGGNPLALVDLAHDLTARELHDSGLAEEPVPVGRHLQAHYLERVRGAAPDVRTWLLVAAADSTGDLGLVGRACAELGVDGRAGEAAEDLGLVALGTTARFRHPLVRAAAYGAARGKERRRVHAALSRAAHAAGTPELAAWHAARATVGVDAGVAERLEAVADAAGARGGVVSRARVLGRAAELTPPGQDRDRRRVAAAEAAVAAGAAQIGAALLDGLVPARPVADADREGPVAPDPVLRARVVAVRVGLGLFTSDPAVVTRAAADMLDAAALLHGTDAAREQDALVRAFEHAVMADRACAGRRCPSSAGGWRRARPCDRDRRRTCCAPWVPSCWRTRRPPSRRCGGGRPPSTRSTTTVRSPSSPRASPSRPRCGTCAAGTPGSRG